MKSAALFVFLIVVVGAGAFIGSVAGAALKRDGNLDLFAGAVIGGFILTLASAVVAARLGLITRDKVMGTAVGAGAGFLVTSAVAINRSSTLPLVAAAILLIGIGGVLGSRFTRSRSSVQ